MSYAATAAEALSVLFALAMLADESGNVADLNQAIDIFQGLFEKTHNNYYLRKIEICQKMKLPDADFRELIGEISVF